MSFLLESHRRGSAKYGISTFHLYSMYNIAGILPIVKVLNFAKQGLQVRFVAPGRRASPAVQDGLERRFLLLCTLAKNTGVEYWRSTAIGAPPTDPAQYDGDQRTPFQKQRCGPPYFCASRLLDTPFRLFTSFEPATFGGQLFHPG
ncbi:hypothetical protein MCRY_19220 [Marivita cryptomonadis]|nr:hypothetical protein MCRY_19220 [Marivita cryptomonadis]